jgi:hypothetical protein
VIIKRQKKRIPVAAVYQKHLNSRASIADIIAKVENDWLESVRKLGQAHDMSTKTVHATLHKN